MPKLIGLVPGLYVEEWIEPAIEQALHYCDDVVVSIGAMVPELQVLQDRTMERAQKYGDRVKFVPPYVGHSFVNARGPTLNAMMEASIAEVGDWLWLLDTDEFYFPQTVQKIREVMATETNLQTMTLGAKFFFINMTRHLHAKHPRLFKITHKGVNFKNSASQNWQGRGEDLGIPLDPDDDQFGMFHYSLLTSPKYRRLFWDTVHSQKSGKVRETMDTKIQWLDEIFMPFELDREDYWIDKNVKLLGLSKRTPLWNHAFPGQPDGTLFKYSGPHPSFIEDAGLHLIEDFRTYRD